ncbi:DUF1491 family protein [Sphingopyxis sp. PET50]|uniref:DUF1491 family protein n=1 Tax=Sphingopyxis sp. PET50 TaxID=2976533 RepID=UPI0021AE6DC5|nr:DUF1491 family protein [Sphingopyxis sp. PET50]
MTRFTSRFLVDLLLRRTEAAGGFAAVLASGDAQSGVILVQCRDRGTIGPLLERRFSPRGDYVWEDIGPSAGEDEAARAAYLDRRKKGDPDLWIVELDIADAPRLVAEWAMLG